MWCCIKVLKTLALAITLILLAATAHYYYWLGGLEVEATDTEQIVEELVGRRLIPGISIATIKNGEVSWISAKGAADLETNRPVTKETLFESASLTKPVIAEIARRLYQKGSYDLDELVAESISNPRIASKGLWQKVTPRHLLSHSAGFPNWSGDSRNPDRDNELSQDFEPGSAFQYSGEGYGLLLEFLEAKSGRSMSELSQELFDELGMTQSTLIAANVEGDFARSYWVNAPGRNPWRTEQPIAAWSLFTNAEEYSKFLLHSMKGLREIPEFAEPEVKVLEFDQGELFFWSLGWGVYQGNRTLHFQWGDNGPFKSLAIFDLKSRDGPVYFINGSLGTIYSDELVASVLGDISPITNWFSDSRLEYVRRWIGL